MPGPPNRSGQRGFEESASRGSLKNIGAIFFYAVFGWRHWDPSPFGVRSGFVREP